MLRVEVWLTTTLILVGIIGGLIYNWPRQESQIPEEKVALANQNVTADSAVDHEPGNLLRQSVNQGIGDQADPGSELPRFSDLDSVRESEAASAEDLLDTDPINVPTNELEQADKFLLVGNFVGAYRLYLKASHQASGRQLQIYLKLGISSEMAGYLDQAEKFYRQAIKQSSENDNLGLLALSGLSRIWISSERLDEAHELLSELFLRIDSDDTVPAEIRMQVAYQLAQVSQLKFLKVRPVKQNDLRSTLFHWSEPDLQAMLKIEIGARSQVTTPLRDAQIQLLQRPSEDISLIAFDVFTRTLPVNQLLSEFADKADLVFEVSPKASIAVSGRSAKMSTEGISLSLALDQLLAPLGLMWDQVGNQVNIRHINDAPAQVVSYRFQQSIRSLNHIELTFPRSDRRNSAMLHQGNLSMLADDFESASKRYSELEAVEPNGELRAKLSFNRAKLDIAANQPRQAVQRLFHAVDQSLNQALKAKGYEWIGKTELEDGNAEQAIYASARGIGLATDSQVLENNVLTLAKAYLLESNPYSCNKVLFDHASAITTQSAKRMASVLGAYARFLGTNESLGLRNEGERMMIALASIEPSDMDGFIDQMLVGRAFFEVGFTTRSSELMQVALENATNESWQRRVAYELGLHKYRAGELATAAKIFSEVALELKDETGVRSQIRLAEISLTGRKPEKCLDLCKELWRLPLSDEQKTTTLEMMGKSYMQLGRPHAAAVCFSGMVPREDSSEPPLTVSPSTGAKTSSLPIFPSERGAFK